MKSDRILRMKSIGIIPSRYASTRFPGKPLAPILGKSLIQRTYENALRCKDLTKVVVATDDLQIYDHVKSFGGEVVMTKPECINGTERIYEASLNYPEFDVIVNIQGDEPCVDPDIISKLLLKLSTDEEAVVSTPIAILKENFENRAMVKCVKALNDRALYFSRSKIPHLAKNSLETNVVYYKHIGIYAFRKDFLALYVELPDTPLQKQEELEQLKILEHGYPITVVLVDYTGFDVNEPSDIKKVENYICQQNLSL